MNVTTAQHYFIEFDEGRLSVSEFISIAMNEFDKTLSACHKEQDRGREQLNEIIKESIKDWISSMEKANKSGFLGKLIKIFMILIVVVTIVTPMCVLTPVALANAFVAILAVCASPLIDQLLQKCAELLGPVAGPIVGMVLLCALMFCSAGALASCGTKIAGQCAARASLGSTASTAGTGAGSLTTQLSNALQKLKEAVLQACGNGLNRSQMRALEEFLNKLNLMILGTQGGLQITQGVFDFQAKKLLAEYKIDQQWIEETGFFLDILAKDTSSSGRQMRDFEGFRNQVFSPF